MKYISHPLLLVCLCSSILAHAVQSDSHTPPNLIVLFIDDMGYGDPGSYGGDLVPTPGIDRLAEEGVRATAGYVTSSNCAPSRHALLTGSYQQRFGIYTNRDTFQNMPGERVPRNHLLLPQVLGEAGYVTGHIGIWNVRRDADVFFDEIYSPMDWGADFFPDENGKYPGVWQLWPYDKASRDYGWGPVREGDEYLTDRLGREAVEFIDAHAEKTFFLHFAPNALHSPLMAKKEHRDKVAHIESEPLQLYAAMLISLDENIIRILDALDDHGISDNTLVYLASDNGASYGYRVNWPEHWDRVMLGSVGKLSGRKGQFREGGLRVPYLMRWPNVLPAGKVYDQPVSTMDVYPTFIAAAGVEIPDETVLDGVNLLPYFLGEKSTVPHDELYWLGQNKASGAVRKGDWKLLIASSGEQTQLFNLREDPAESNDLTANNLELAAELLSAWQAFSDRMPDSFYDRYRAAKAAYEATYDSPPRALHKINKE